MTSARSDGEDSVMEHFRAFVHEDGEYLSIGFQDTNDTLLKMPDGERDRATVVAWVEAVNRSSGVVSREDDSEHAPERIAAQISSAGFIEGAYPILSDGTGKSSSDDVDYVRADLARGVVSDEREAELLDRAERAERQLTDAKLEAQQLQREVARGVVEAVRVEEFCQRVNRLGGFQRAERGEFWISRDDVLRLADEVFGSPPTGGGVSRDNWHDRDAIQREIDNLGLDRESQYIAQKILDGLNDAGWTLTHSSGVVGASDEEAAELLDELSQVYIDLAALPEAVQDKWRHVRASLEPQPPRGAV